MDQRTSLRPVARRSVIPRPAEAAERPAAPPVAASPLRWHSAACALLLAGGAALGFHASLAAEAPAPVASHAATTSVTTPDAPPVPVAAPDAPAVVERPAAAFVAPAAPARRPARRARRPMLASAERSSYTLIILP